MGNCMACLHAKQRDGNETDAKQMTAGRHEGQQASNGDEEGSFRDNSQLNSFMSQRSKRAIGRQASLISRATSALSWRSAHSNFDEDGVSDGDWQSADLDRLNSHDGGKGGDRLPGASPPSSLSRNSHDHVAALNGAGGGHYQRQPSGSSPLSGNSPGTLTPPEGAGISRVNSLNPKALRKAWEAEHGSRTGSKKRRLSHAGSLSSTLSRRHSTAGSDMGILDHEREACPEHVDLAAYDKATLAAANAIFGQHAATFAELPVLPVAPWNRQPGYLGHLTTAQAEALATMQTRFPDYKHFHNDHDLLRFLRARSFDVTAATKMYDKYCHVYRERLLVSPAPIIRPTMGREWSLQHVELFPPRPAGATEAMRDAFRCFLHVTLFGSDRMGRPVVYMKVGDVVKNSMTQYVQLPMRISIQSASNELNKLVCMMASAQANYHIEEFMQVVDVKGPSVLQMIKHMRSIENQAEFSHNSDYVPESLGKVVVLNAPFGAGPAWTLAKVFIPKSTQEKIAICSSDYTSELLKHIDAENLPSCYGGSAQFDWEEHEKPKHVYK